MLPTTKEKVIVNNDCNIGRALKSPWAENSVHVNEGFSSLG